MELLQGRELNCDVSLHNTIYRTYKVYLELLITVTCNLYERNLTKPFRTRSVQLWQHCAEMCSRLKWMLFLAEGDKR